MRTSWKQEAVEKLIKLTKTDIDSKTSYQTTAVALASKWADGTLELKNENFISDKKYIYVLSLDSESISTYESGKIWASPITTNGIIKIYTDSEQPNDLTFTIFRMEAETNNKNFVGSKVISNISAAKSAIKPNNPQYIYISVPPLKTTYYVGDVFETAGMKVFVHYENGDEVETTNYTYDPVNSIPYGTTKITITYIESGITMTAEQPITVIRESVAIPSQDGTLTYNGDSQNAIFKNYDQSKMTVSGQIYGTNAQRYTAKFNLISDRYEWTDGTRNEQTVYWTIDRATIQTVPSQKDVLTYTGSPLKPDWNNYDQEKMSISGEETAIESGSHYVEFRPNSNYQWSDGTFNGVRVEWTIEKATATLTATPLTLNLTGVVGESSTTATITVTRPGDGEVIATGYDRSALDVTVNSATGPNPTITVKAIGTTLSAITIFAQAGKNYKATTGVNVSVSSTVLPAKKTLEQSTWAEISAVSKAGYAKEYWSIGDTKSIQYGEHTCYVQIIGIYHDDVTDYDTYGRSKAGITFQFGVANNSAIGGMDPITRAAMNGQSTNNGGWKSCELRSKVIPRELERLPTELQSVIVAVDKLTSKGNSSTAVDTTSDELFLLSEIEVHGITPYSEGFEGEQYEFYTKGNSTIRYRDGVAYDWWLRSPRGGSTSFCMVRDSGNPGASYASEIAGISFAFCV